MQMNLAKPTSLSCMTCLRKKFSLLADLSYDELYIINQNKTVAQFKKGECIFKQGMKPYGLYCLSYGKVKMVKLCHSGNEQILSLKKPVDFLGFSEMMSEENYQVSAVALEDLSVCIIKKEDFFNVIHSNLQFAMKVIKHFASELIRVEQRAEDLTQKQMEARIADALLFINRIYGMSDSDQCLDIDLKRSDLAALSNMSVENVSRHLRSLSNSGLIKINKRRIKILDTKKLELISLTG